MSEEICSICRGQGLVAVCQFARTETKGRVHILISTFTGGTSFISNLFVVKYSAAAESCRKTIEDVSGWVGRE